MFRSKKFCLLLLAVIFFATGCAWKKASMNADEASVDELLLQASPASAPPQVDPGLPQQGFEQDVQGALKA